MKSPEVGVALLLATLGAGCATSGPQPQAPSVATMSERSPGRVAETSVVTVTAIVEHVDQRQRLVTLRAADGKTRTIHVGPEVRNLAQVEKGDEVAVGYVEAVAIEVNKGEGELGVVAGEDAVRAEPGGKPGGAAARTIKVTAKIVEIDRENDEVTLEGKDGTRVVIDIRDPQHYDAIAVGDLVDFTFAEAVAVSVEPATVE